MDSQVTIYYHDRVYVYSLQGIQPSQHGWRASDFSEGRPHIWAGMLRITSSTSSDDSFIVLEHDSRDGKTGVFASCLATPENVEQVIDSSRFYVLRITNGNNHAFIGMGFQDKQPAFDFKSELASVGSKARARDELMSAPKQDFSLQKGAKITMSLKGVAAKNGTAAAAAPAAAKPAAGGLADFSAFSIAPPTAGGRKPAAPSAGGSAAGSSAAASGSSGSADLAALLGGGSAPKAAAPSASPSSTAMPGFDFGTGSGAAAAVAPADPFAAFSEATGAKADKPTTAADAKKKGSDPFDFGDGWAF